MKLFSAFNHTFTTGYTFVNSIYEAARQMPDLNGVFIAQPDFVSVNSSNQVESIYNLIYDTSYMLGSVNSRPTFIASDPQFNGNPCIDFNDNGVQSLNLSVSLNVGTIVIVYLTRVIGSCLISSTGAIAGDPPIYYDSFPPNGSQLWGNETLDGGDVYNALSRINGKNVSPDVFIPLNNTRILSVTNISRHKVVGGFGGASGALGGSQGRTGGKSVRGRIAAIITSASSCPLGVLANLESVLATIYIDYKGVVISSQPSFRYFVGEFFTFDFGTIAVDEFFDITVYTFVLPLTLPLTFTGSVLSGIIPFVFDGTFTITIANSGGLTSTFTFSLETVKADPFVLTLPQYSKIGVVLSTDQDSLGNPYGIYTDDTNNIIAWEDARRLPDKPRYTLNDNASNINLVTYNLLLKKVLFQSNSIATQDVKTLLSTGVPCKTFVWVYKQLQAGQRIMAENFNDILGNGVLWTTPTLNTVFGTTPTTKLVTEVNNVLINVFNYKLPIGYHTIITAVTTSDAVNFSGFTTLLKGELEFFAGWTASFLSSEIADLVSLLGTKFFPVTLLVFDTSIEYRYIPVVTVDLTRKVTELTDAIVTYTIITNHYGATVDSNGLLSFTTNTDDFVTFTITASTTATSVTFDFSVSITLLTSQLYIELKLLFNIFSVFYIVNSTSATIGSGAITQLTEYRNNGSIATGVGGVTYTTLHQLDDNPTASFVFNGSSHLNLNTSQAGYCFIVGYIRAEGQTGKAFLFGQTNINNFQSGDNGQILQIDFYGELWVNGELRPATYVLPQELLSVVIFNSEILLNIDTVAKDRLFTDRSVKGYIPFFCVVPYKIDPALFPSVEESVRDYYQAPCTVLLINTNLAVIDQSIKNKSIISNINDGYTAIKKFGSGSFPVMLNSSPSYIFAPNQGDFAYMYMDFTIAGWLLLNKNVGLNTVIVFVQDNLCLYVKEDKLYLGRNTISDLALFSISLDEYLSGVVFFHIALCRYNGTTQLFVNGVAIYGFADSFIYLDYNTDFQIGTTVTPTVAGITMLLNSFVIYRRIAQYKTSSFALPISPYTSL